MKGYGEISEGFLTEPDKSGGEKEYFRMKLTDLTCRGTPILFMEGIQPCNPLLSGVRIDPSDVYL